MKCPTCGHDGEIDDQAHRGAASALVREPQGMAAGSQPTLFAEEPDATGISGSKPAAGPAAKSRRSQLSATWQPTEAQQLYCRQQGKDSQAMAEAFTQYYRAKGSVWKDWGLVWMRACRDWNTTPQIAQRNGTTIKDQTLSLWELRLSCKTWNAFWGPRVGEPGCQVPRELWP